MGRVRILNLPGANGVPLSAGEFLRELGGPTFIRIAGRDPKRTRAVTTLLHGNEPSGFRAVHAWLRRGITPAVNVVVFVGSVKTALEPPGFAHRALPGRLDLNRCFVAPCEGAEPELASEALQLLRCTGPEALVDIHNTSGDTPPCGIGPVVDVAHVNLVSLFADRYVHSDLQIGALVEATQSDFPGVVVECGRAGSPAADAVARKGLNEYLDLQAIETRHLRHQGMKVLDRMIRVCLTPSTSVVFRDRPASGVDLTIRDDVDRYNFEALAPGTLLGWVDSCAPWPLLATGADGRDRSRGLFAIRDGVLETRREIIPIMLTTNAESVANDCLFYLAHLREPPPDRHDSG